MTVSDCLKMLREIKDVAFATVDEKGKPQIRIIDIMFVEEERIYFCTSRGKEFYHQLMRSGDVAITGMSDSFQMIRVNGEAKKVCEEEQKECIDHIFRENPSMCEVYPGESRYVLDAFQIGKGQIEFFDLGKTPIYRETFLFGQWAKEEKGFVITDACIGCGTCREVCPQQCIDEGIPYRIRQENCLHCGLCYEKCPAGAILKRGSSDDSGNR